VLLVAGPGVRDTQVLQISRLKNLFRTRIIQLTMLTLPVA
jgi:hypothetical protein